MKPSWLILVGWMILALYNGLEIYAEGDYKWFNWEAMHWEIFIPIVIIFIITITYLDRNYTLVKKEK